MARSRAYTGIAFGFIIVLMMVVVSITYFNLMAIEDYTRNIKEESLPYELMTDTIEINILKTQELLTDTALTAEPNGFALAEETAGKVLDGLKQSMGVASKKNETAVLQELEALDEAFQIFYATGRNMATFFLHGETEQGNKTMIDFDSRGEDLLSRYESIRDLQVQTEKADTDRILTTIHQAKILLLSTCLIAICASILTAFAVLSLK